MCAAITVFVLAALAIAIILGVIHQIKLKLRASSALVADPDGYWDRFADEENWA